MKLFLDNYYKSKNDDVSNFNCLSVIRSYLDLITLGTKPCLLNTVERTKCS